MKRGLLRFSQTLWRQSLTTTTFGCYYTAEASPNTSRILCHHSEWPSLERTFYSSLRPGSTEDSSKADACPLKEDKRSEGAGGFTAEASTDGTNSQANEEPLKGEDPDASTKDDPLTFIPVGIFGCASLVLAGYGLSYLREKDEQDVGVLAMIERAMDNAVEWLSSLVATEEGPLLPDIKELNYPPNLPTLVVDLDKVVAKLEYDRRTGWQVKKRPYADRFFRELVNYYEIVIWSDDSYPVATDVANRWGLPVIGCIHRDQCKKLKGSYLKDLSKLGRDLRRVILLDHDRMACMMQEQNAILVREFDGDEEDKELLYLLGLLKTIAVNPSDVTLQLQQMGGGLDLDLGRKFAEKSMENSQKAKSRQNISKMLGFKHY